MVGSCCYGATRKGAVETVAVALGDICLGYNVVVVSTA